MTSLYFFAGLTILPLFIWGIYAHNRVRQLFQQYSKVPIKKGITGNHLARTMLNSAGLKNVVIEEVGPTLGDHYDPRHKVIRLSRKVARNSSVSAIGIAAHEAAHAIQDGTGYGPVKVRNTIAPVVEKTSYLIMPFLLFGVIMGGIISSAFFINLAVLFFLGIVIFYVVTLPVEFEASSRALRYIKEKDIADEEELEGIRKVLRAAAFTYIIAATLSIMQFLKVFGMLRSK